MLRSEFIHLEQRGQSGGAEKLHAIQVHNHDPRHGQLRDQKISQFQPGRSVDLTYYRDHPSAGSELSHLQTGAGGKVAAHRHTRHNIVCTQGSTTQRDQSC